MKRWQRKGLALLAIDTVAVVALLSFGSLLAHDKGVAGVAISDPWSSGTCPTQGPRLFDAADVCYSLPAVQARRATATTQALGLAAREGCVSADAWPTGQIPARAIVRRDADDRVQVLTFDAAWKQAKAGKVWTLYLCAK